MSDCVAVLLQNCVLRKKLREVENSMHKVFSSDQVRAMENKSRGTCWSQSTVKKALQIRYACGSRGYQFLRQGGFPLPAYRTLCNRVEQLHMAPGINATLLDMLSTKLSVYSEGERDCCLLIDEVQLKEKVEYDKGLKRIVGMVGEDIYGNSTKSLASHALCYMVRGIRTNWKQVVAWYGTGAATPGAKQWDIAKQIIELLYARGITVRAVVSDMGPNNQSMWKQLGIASKRDGVVNCVQHPVASSIIYFLADVPHLLKNLRNMLLTHYITLPDVVVQRHSLPVSKVSCIYFVKKIKNVIVCHLVIF